MKTLFSKHPWMQIIFGASFLVAGILLIILSVNSINGNIDTNLDVWLSVVLAIVFFVFGASIIMDGIFSLHEKYFNLLFVLGAVSIAFGVVLCYKSEMIGEFVMALLGSFVLAFAVIELGSAVAMIFFKKPKFFIALFFILGTILMTGGVLIIVFQDDLKQYVYTVFGGAFVLIAMFQIVFGVKNTISNRKNKEKEPEAIPDGVVLEVNPFEEEKQEPTQSEVPEIQNNEDNVA